jgi:hypothetical protein
MDTGGIMEMEELVVHLVLVITLQVSLDMLFILDDYCKYIGGKYQ